MINNNSNLRMMILNNNDKKYTLHINIYKSDII